MHPSEIEFLAENETIQIIPTFNHASHIHLICGSFGPFRAGLPLNVPIWVALNLRQKKTCRILAPDWMTVDKLQERLEEEKASKYYIPTYIVGSLQYFVMFVVFKKHFHFQILYTITNKLLPGNHTDATIGGRRGYSTRK